MPQGAKLCTSELDTTYMVSGSEDIAGHRYVGNALRFQILGDVMLI